MPTIRIEEDDYRRTLNEVVQLRAQVAELRESLSGSLYRQVGEFHQAVGFPVLHTPTVPDRPRIQLRLRLVLEESFELFDAVLPAGRHALANAKAVVASLIETECEPKHVDLVETADACGDLDYVVEGLRLEFGILGKPIANEIHRSNMAKAGPDGRMVVRHDGKILKPSGWIPPDIAGLLVTQGWKKP